MALLMKPQCEKCKATVPATGAAFICAFECTFCADCSAMMKNVCPNCGGELVRRPRAKATQT